MALVGGALAVWLTGGVVSLGALVGCLTVVGIAARNGILMVTVLPSLHARFDRSPSTGPHALDGAGRQS
jgi:Cu/Ag efflux pump CusA